MLDDTSPDRPDGSVAVLARQNEISTGGIMTTASSRHITTAATGVQSDQEANSNCHIYVNGHLNWNQTLQHAENVSTTDAIGRRSYSVSPTTAVPKHNTDTMLDQLPPRLGTQAMFSRCVEDDSSSPLAEVCEALSSSTPSTLKEYQGCFDTVANNIGSSYKDILSQIKRIRRSKTTRERLRSDVMTQRDVYAVISSALVKTLDNRASPTDASENSLFVACFRIYTAIKELWFQLQQVQLAIRKIGSKSENRSVPAEAQKAELEAAITDLSLKLDDFKRHARQVIKDKSPPKPTTQEASDVEMKNIQRLSIEGQVSTLLHQCLCQACSERCHPTHYAYLSLEPEHGNGKPSKNPGDPEQMTWKCHMAFKSTITKKTSLIWLRVESSLVNTRIPSDEAFETRDADLEVVSGSSGHSRTLTPNPKKRRAESMAVGPSQKALKTEIGQCARRVSAPSPPTSLDRGFQVCPEVFGQYDIPDSFVMNMVDNSGTDHHLFCLPKDERPVPGDKSGKPIALSDILGSRRSKFWIIRISRLIAEAVLRFDLKDSDPSPEDSVVFYKSAEHDLAPFLERVIRKPTAISYAVDDDEHSSGPRSVLLLNLAQILLQLGLIGLPTPEKLRGIPQNETERRSYISEKAPSACINMGDAYSQVILSCVEFSTWEKHMYGNENFKEQYYRSIVKPLKGMEDALLSCQINLR
ncbi:hypothetical protein CI238_00657 [Colletotrichum incanum]|uniref:Uncharacterized protein n=1 Tax=Colletotrichum incanum TaxID=1573173 RepID=A0A166M3T9_COLIC|nr:hypothetical protein CI238_00657 [Colletotrichum incanum]